jgi:hypothetical protein
MNRIIAIIQSICSSSFCFVLRKGTPVAVDESNLSRATARWELLALVKNAEEIADQNNQQYGTKAYAGSTAGTPAAMSVISATSSENQQQNDQ